MLGQTKILSRAVLVVGTLVCLTYSPEVLAATEPDLPFEPTLSVNATTTAAGAHPSTTIEISKPNNRCTDPSDEVNCGDPIEQQDFQKLHVKLPAGLVANINTVDRCDPKLAYYDLGWETNPIGGYSTSWYCPASTKVGDIEALVSNCAPSTPSDALPECRIVTLDDSPLPFEGGLYMGVPGDGEQARLVALVGLNVAGVIEFDNEVVISAPITVDRHGDIFVDVPKIPDLDNGIETDPGDLIGTYGDLVFQPYSTKITVDGSVSKNGDSLLSNPTACSSKSLAMDVQGYAYNVGFINDDDRYDPGYGTGKTVSLSADYPVNHCNSIPYNPQFNLSFDPKTPSAIPAITATLDQSKGEQTTDSVSMKIPAGFGINLNTTAGFCSDDQFNSLSCPESSKIGTAVASSEILPITTPEVTSPLYLLGDSIGSGKFKLAMNLANSWLPGGIDVVGEATVNSDSSIDVKFTDLPELPIKSFKLDLYGNSNQGILKNPSNCGTKTFDVTLTSHQGTELRTKPTVSISCDEASLQAELDTKKPNANPDISLLAAAKGMSSVSFTLPKGLTFSSSLEKGKKYGNTFFTTASGTVDTKLVLVSSSGNTQTFSAAENGSTQITQVTVTTSGQVSSKSKKKSKKKKSKKKSKSKARVTAHTASSKSKCKKKSKKCRSSKKTKKTSSTGTTQVTFDHLPEDTTAVSFELLGNVVTVKGKSEKSTKRYIALPSTSEKLGFSATVTNFEGKTMTPAASVEMSKAKKAKKKKKKSKKRKK